MSYEGLGATKSVGATTAAAVDPRIAPLLTLQIPVDITTWGRDADERNKLKKLHVMARQLATRIVNEGERNPARFREIVREFSPEYETQLRAVYTRGKASGASGKVALVMALIPEIVRGLMIHAATLGVAKQSSGVAGLGSYDGLGGLCDPGHLCPSTGIYPWIAHADETTRRDPSWAAELDDNMAIFVGFFKQGAFGGGGMIAAVNKMRAMVPPPGRSCWPGIPCPDSGVPGLYNGWADLHQSFVRVAGNDPEMPLMLFTMWHEFWPGGPCYPPRIPSCFFAGVPVDVLTGIGDWWRSGAGQAIGGLIAILGAVITAIYPPLGALIALGGGLLMASAEYAAQTAGRGNEAAGVLQAALRDPAQRPEAASLQTARDAQRGGPTAPPGTTTASLFSGGNKKWLLAGAIGIGALALLGVGLNR